MVAASPQVLYEAMPEGLLIADLPRIVSPLAGIEMDRTQAAGKTDEKSGEVRGICGGKYEPLAVNDKDFSLRSK